MARENRQARYKKQNRPQEQIYSVNQSNITQNPNNLNDLNETSENVNNQGSIRFQDERYANHSQNQHSGRFAKPSNQDLRRVNENENYRSGYNSEPENIQRSYNNRSNVSSNRKSESRNNRRNINQNMPSQLDSQYQSNGITDTFHSRHFIKLPKLVIYDGQDFYLRPSH